MVIMILLNSQFIRLYISSFHIKRFEMPSKNDGQRSSEIIKIQTYNSLRSQLEAENAALMRERLNIQQENNNYPAQNSTSQVLAGQHRNDQQLNQMQSEPSRVTTKGKNNVVQNLKSKIGEIISLCQTNKGVAQFSDIAEAEKQILTFLDNLNSSEIKQSPTHSGLDKKVKRKKSKLNKTVEESQNFKIGQQAMEMIQEIQRKALIQIQSLRADKIALMKRLNEQIKAHNQQKRLRLTLENKIKSQNKKYEGRMQIVAEENQDLEGQTPTKNAQPNLNSQNNHSVSKNNSNQRSNVNNSFRQHKNEDQQVLRQIENLKAENQRMKKTMLNNPNYKNQLRTQLNQLHGKILHYEQIFENQQRIKPKQQFSELQNLLYQGNSLSDQGNRLLKTKKSSDYPRGNTNFDDSSNRPSQRLFRPSNESRQQERAGTFDYSRPPLQTFSPMDKSYHTHGYNNKNQFSPSKYEDIIEQMNRAIKN